MRCGPGDGLRPAIFGGRSATRVVFPLSGEFNGLLFRWLLFPGVVVGKSSFSPRSLSWTVVFSRFSDGPSFDGGSKRHGPKRGSQKLAEERREKAASSNTLVCPCTV